MIDKLSSRYGTVGIQASRVAFSSSSITRNRSKECIFCSLFTSFGLAPRTFSNSLECLDYRARYCLIFSSTRDADLLWLLVLLPLLCLLPPLCLLLSRWGMKDWLLPKYSRLGQTCCARLRMLSSLPLLHLSPRSSLSFNSMFCSGSSPTDWERLLPFPYDFLGMVRLDPPCLSSIRSVLGILRCCLGGDFGLGGGLLRFWGRGVRDLG